MALTTKASALVAGGMPPVSGVVPTRWVRVERAFLLRGARQEPGTVLDLPAPLVAELVTAHKATPCEPPTKADEQQPEATKRAKKE